MSIIEVDMSFMSFKESNFSQYKIGLGLLLIIAISEMILMYLLSLISINSHLTEAIVDTLFISIIAAIGIWKIIIVPYKKSILNGISESVKELGNDIHAIDHLAIISICDLKGKITYANKNFCKISGYKSEELIEQDHRILNSGYHSKEFFQEVWSCLESGKAWQGQVRNKHKNGTFYWVNSYCAPIFDETNKTKRYVSFRFDITQQKNAEEAIKKISNENLAILRSAKYAIITTKIDGTISGFNNEAEAILGYKSADVVGKSTPSIFHDQYEIISKANQLGVLPGFEVFIYNANNGNPDENQWTYIRKDGHRFQVKLSITALYNDHGVLYGYMGIAKDISEELKIKEELDYERSKHFHNAQLASIGEFSTGIAHEINNPLSIIAGTVPFLEKFKDNPEKFASKIQSIEKSVERIDKIVKKLKKFTHKTEADEREIKILSEIVEEVIALTENKAVKCNTKIEIIQNTLGKINCNEIEIEQVLINLINNAIDAVKNFDEKWVKIYTYIDQSELVLRVKDSGNGIPEEIEAKLFQPFFTTKKMGDGTGLGLSIIKEIIEQHNGSISIDRLEKNTCFEVRFPLAL
jgi:PAS domain S-box-containing protein